MNKTETLTTVAIEEKNCCICKHCDGTNCCECCECYCNDNCDCCECNCDCEKCGKCCSKCCSKSCQYICTCTGAICKCIFSDFCLGLCGAILDGLGDD